MFLLLYSRILLELFFGHLVQRLPHRRHRTADMLMACLHVWRDELRIYDVLAV